MRALVYLSGLVSGALVLSGCGEATGDVSRAETKRSALSGASDTITLTIESQLGPRRNALLTAIWGTTSLPTLQATLWTGTPTNNCVGSPAWTTVSLTQELRVAEPGGLAEGLACLFVSSRPNGHLVIFNPGHANNVNDGSDWTRDSGSYGDHRAIQTLLSEGYSVLLTFMPFFRPDESCVGSCHANMFTNWHPATGSVWQYFLDPVLGGLNYVQAHAGSGGIPSFTEFDMVGLSGGGWTTTIYAAVDTRITTSIPVAGSEPLDFWVSDGEGNGSNGAEQTVSGLYNGVAPGAAYRDLYVLGAAGAGRRQVQVLNRHDDCCFFPGWQGLPASSWQSSVRSYETAVRSTLANMGDTGIFRLEIDEAAVQHQISRNTLGNVILPELGGGRKHVAAVGSSDAFARGANGDMWHWSSSSGWEDTAIAMVGVPAVVQVPGGAHALDVFYRDPGNNLRRAWKSGSSWTSGAMTGVVVSDPAAVSWGTGRFDVIAFGGDYVPYHWSSAQSGFDAPIATLAGVGTPTMASAGSGSLDIVFRDLSSGVTRLAWNGTAWITDRPGGVIYGLPSLTVTPGPVRRVYAFGTDANLYENANSGSGWSGWASVSSAAGVSTLVMGGSPSATTRSSDSAAVVYVRFSNSLLGHFTRSGSWGFSNDQGSIEGAPTAVSLGGAWAAGTPSDVRWFDGASWANRGGGVE